ncbi:hypothetical protein I316_05574 [Kwoniella heveanensis BCC8398]|uniref:F-box domain-containing protein n=1 Tax=Kwoniella heveanensis BCC8398 TaxID=1296120 RepID=A0A1B9GNS5_9TREE|nr:hypothetical protein I316_05574 [Kwoniella heveanensis BCC8398]
MHPTPALDHFTTPAHHELGGPSSKEGVELHDELDLVNTAPTPTRGARKLPHVKPKRTPGKWKGKRAQADAEDGQCHLLNLPEDLIHLLLSRLPPRSLLQLSSTCRALHDELEDESIWRASYVNRFLFEDAARRTSVRKEVRVLVQGCLNSGGRGWKREALSREAMLDRWTDSKASMVIHTPPTSLIHNLSLSYPPFVPAVPRSLVVGKNHASSKGTTSPSLLATPATPQSTTGESFKNDASLATPTKLTHRQKYEAMLAATTRPPPYIMSATLVYGGVVRSDPISGKVSKGFWGPGRDANFHLRPHLDPAAEATALYLHTRIQSHILWGLRTGSCVHTTVQSRHHATHGGRASSINVHSDPNDSHFGEINDIWQPEVGNTEQNRWVTAGEDGRVKLWAFNPGSGNPRSGKRTPGSEINPASISCLFTSGTVEQPLPNRSDASKRRQSGRPDEVLSARYEQTHDVVCGVTEDGDLRVWFDASTSPQEVRIDVGAAEIDGEVKMLALDARNEEDGVVASMLILHRRSPSVARYDANHNGLIRTIRYSTPTGASIAALYTSFRPTSTIAPPPNGQSLSARIITPNETPESISPPPFDLPPLLHANTPERDFGKFVVAGDDAGYIHIWAWDEVASGQDCPLPIRSWEAMSGRITSLDYSCGLVAVGSHDGYIKVFDPLPTPPLLLRTFHASHLTPGEALVAASDELDARLYTVNKVILENDLVVASIGRKIFAWRAGSGKGRQGGKESNGWRRASGGRGDKGSSRGLDMKAIHQAAVDDLPEINPSPSAWARPRVQSSRHEANEIQAMEEMGLENGEDALQYALMLSMEEQGQGSSSHPLESEWDIPTEEADVTDISTTQSSARDESRSISYASTISTASTEIATRDEGENDDGMDAETREAIRQVEAFKRQEEDELGRMLEMIRLAEEQERSQGGEV